MKIICITSDHYRHKYVINRLVKELDVVAVFAEEKAFFPEESAESDEDKREILNHFKLREDAERKYFGENKKFQLNNKDIYYVKRSEINEKHIIDKIKSYEPEAIAVYGSGILKQPLIDICPNSMLNIHLGLSPYYRGSGTNFWPFVNEEPEYAGVTIHYIDPGIDTGKIIRQGYAPIEKGDQFHDIGCKTIILTADLFVKSFKELENKTINPGVKQTEKGKLYMRKDFNVDAVRKLYKLFREGLIDRFLEEIESGERIRPKIIK